MADARSRVLITVDELAGLLRENGEAAGTAPVLLDVRWTLMQPDGRVAQLRIETGRRVGDRVEVLTPLAADARVVVQGAGFLNDGDLVRVAP